MASRGFFGFFSMPTVRAEEEEEDLVDPQAELREKCAQKPHMEALYARLQECNDRVNSRTETTENCLEELFDYIGEVDHCVSHSLFHKLK